MGGPWSLPSDAGLAADSFRGDSGLGLSRLRSPARKMGLAGQRLTVASRTRSPLQKRLPLLLLFSNKEVFIKPLSQYLASSHHVVNGTVIVTALDAGLGTGC